MDTEIRDIVVPDNCICVEQRERDIIVYMAGQSVLFSVTTCVILHHGEQTTALRQVEMTDAPSIGKGTWTRTEREHITNQHGASSRLIDKTAWKLVASVEAPQQQPATAAGSFLHPSARPVIGARHG